MIIAFLVLLQAPTGLLPQWTLTQTRILGASGEPAFGIIYDAVADSAGNLFVLDASNDPFITAFTPDGRVRWRVGRKGEGPGDFRQPRVLGMQPGSLWVGDMVLRRYTRLDRNGHVLAGVIVLPSSPNPHLRQSLPFSLTRSGDVLVTDIGNPDRSRTGITLLRAKPSGQTAEALAFVARAHSYLDVRLTVNGHSGAGQFQQPFTDDPLVQAAKDGSSFVIVDRAFRADQIVSSFTVTKLNERGDTGFSRQFQYSPERLTDQAFSIALEELSQLPTRMKRGVAVSIDDLRKNAYRPQYLPPVKFLTVASDGTIWLHRESLAGQATYLVLGGDGVPMGTAELPKGQRVIESNGTTVWSMPIRQDEEPVLTAFRIERSKRPTP